MVLRRASTAAPPALGLGSPKPSPSYTHQPQHTTTALAPASAAMMYEYTEPRTPTKALTTPFFTAAALHKRTLRMRLRSHSALATLALLTLAALSLFALQSSLLIPSPYRALHHDTDSEFTLPRTVIHAAAASQSSGWSRKPQLQLQPAQELAAVTAFVAVGNNVALPRSVDPSKPIDPQLVLDFDTTRSNALEELEGLVQDTWYHNPVVLFTSGTPQSKEIESLIADMHLRPAPTIVAVNDREDGETLEPILFRLTHTTSLPLLLVGGTPIPTANISRLHASKELHSLVADAGAVPERSRKPRTRKQRAYHGDA